MSEPIATMLHGNNYEIKCKWTSSIWQYQILFVYSTTSFYFRKKKSGSVWNHPEIIPAEVAVKLIRLLEGKTK